MNAIIADANIAPIGNLQHLGLQAFTPHRALSAWVQCYWTMHQPALPAAGYKQTLYPDGGSSLNFHFYPEQLPCCYFNGLQTVGSQQFCGALNAVGIRFYPGGAFQLLGQQVSAWQDDIVHGAELGILTLMPLLRQLAVATDNASRLRCLDQWLLQQMQLHQAMHGPIQQILPVLMQPQPLILPSITALSAEVSLSRRQFERKFLQQVGLTPGQLKLLQRVRHARRLINIDPQQSLTEIALYAGFYDQPHFIRQFQRITGQTPGQYRRRKQTEKTMSQKYNSD